MGERTVKDFSMPLSDLGKPDEDFVDFADYPGFVKWTVQEPAGGKKHPECLYRRTETGGYVYGNINLAEVHFTGKLLDGTVFASSREKGIPLLLPRFGFPDVMFCRAKDVLELPEDELPEDFLNGATEALSLNFELPEDVMELSEDELEFSNEFSNDVNDRLALTAVGVMEGFLLAIRSMQPGEKSIFTVPVALTLSVVTGSPARIPWNIPPDQTLRFDIELISFTHHIFNNRGILKKIIRLGEEMWKPPHGFDHVFVNYNVRLEDGTLVSKSEDVKFSEREGFFCPAFAHAVKTMEIGEEAILIVKPKYGFGEQGRPAKGNEPAVPPDATLYVNLKLTSSVSYVGMNRDIIKKFITIPRRYNLSGRPYNEAVVKVRLIGKLQDGTVFDRRGHDQEEPLKFTIDEEHVIYGLDEAVMTMREGEVASFTIPPQHAFGVTGSNQYHLAIVPPNSVVTYEMELLSVVEDGLVHEYTTDQPITDEEFIEAAKIKEREGDDLFSSGKYLRAYRRYLKARKMLPPCFLLPHRMEHHQIKEVLISITLKCAECAILLQYYEAASKRWKEVLSYSRRGLRVPEIPLPKSPDEIDSYALHRDMERYSMSLNFRGGGASLELPYRPSTSGRRIIVPALPVTPVSTPALPQPQSPAP